MAVQEAAGQTNGVNGAASQANGTVDGASQSIAQPAFTPQTQINLAGKVIASKTDCSQLSAGLTLTMTCQSLARTAASV